jgi:hypothetical protein
MMATLGGCGDGYELPCYRIKESGDLPDDTSPFLEGFSPFGPSGISGNQK